MFERNIFDVPTRSVETSRGPVSVPSFLLDGSAVVAVFGSPIEAVSAKLSGSGLVPVKLPGGRALTVLGFFDHRDTSFGPYREATLMVGAVPAGSEGALSLGLDFLKPVDSRKLGFHVLDLPLTSELALAAGREHWGLPKFLADIEYHYAENSFEASIKARGTGGEILGFSGPFCRGIPAPLFHCIYYSASNNALLRTSVTLKSMGRMSGGAGASLEVGALEHRMATNMRDLGLDSARPLAVQSTDKLRCRMDASTKVMDIETPDLPYGSTDSRENAA